MDEGYYVAKNALHENFGLPHIKAKAHIRKLENLRPLKQADGTSLLEFARHLELANRTLSGMGSEYISDLNHTNTLRELNKKLPFFMRIKWTECAGRIISAGSKPQFADFLKFLKDRAKLVNNEFGEDLTTSSKERVNVKQKDLWGRPPSRVTSLATGVRGQQGNLRRMNPARPVCVVCRGHHGVCSVVPVKVLVKDSSLMPVQTYALLDSGSEVTLCHEKLRERLGASGTKLQFTLSGMTGSSRVESQQLDLVVMSMDESVSVELPNVRTVKYMPISESCIAKKEDLENWPHLSDIELQQLDIGGVMLVIGLKEKPNLFLPLECRAGEEGEPVAVRYSLGWR